MFGGGEEYFQEPEAIDVDTLKRFATLGSRLRAAEKPGKKTINELSRLVKEVGTSQVSLEMTVGLLFRHIKSSCGQPKQLVFWYVLDKLCKEDRDKYAHLASMHMIEIGCDFIPWEDSAMEPKFTSLVQHWETVFPQHVIDAVWSGKKERLWQAQHADEVALQRKEEEEEWKKEELRQAEVDGLDDYGQPCLDYLQGRCTWGDQCKQLHPPGLEGSLPLECRLGDWKCTCGTINRHFRRRCASCPKEKPQYRRLRDDDGGSGASALASPDESLDAILSTQFGFNPNDQRGCVGYWRNRFGGVGGGSSDENAEVEQQRNQQWRQERSAGYRTRILKKSNGSALDQRAASTLNWRPLSESESSSLIRAGGATGGAESGTAEEPPRKKRATEVQLRLPEIPPTFTTHVQRFGFLLDSLTSKGVHHPDFAGHLFLISQELSKFSIADFTTIAQLSAAFSKCAQMVFNAWNVAPSGKAKETHPAVPFFHDVGRYLRRLQMGSAQLANLSQMSSVVAQATNPI